MRAACENSADGCCPSTGTCSSSDVRRRGRRSWSSVMVVGRQLAWSPLRHMCGGASSSQTSLDATTPGDRLLWLPSRGSGSGGCTTQKLAPRLEGGNTYSIWLGGSRTRRFNDPTWGPTPPWRQKCFLPKTPTRKCLTHGMHP